MQQKNIKASIAQVNSIVGDFEYNCSMIKDYWRRAEEDGADFIIFSELVVTGYNPQDLILRRGFVDAAEEVNKILLAFSSDLKCAAIIGSVIRENNQIYNAALVLKAGNIIYTHKKIMLPNFGVFDDKRIFSPGENISLFELNGAKISVLICEDLWHEEVRSKVAENKPDILCVLNASPYTKTKKAARIAASEAMARECECNLMYVNQVGLQDSIIYDGNSFLMNNKGEIVFEIQKFKEKYQFFKIDDFASSHQTQIDVSEGLEHSSEKLSEIYDALIFALRDYLKKNNIEEVTLGFSSGIDSSLTSLIAFDAIGKDNVKLFAMPSEFTSKETYRDAEEFEKINSIKCEILSIKEIYESYIQLLNVEENKSSFYKNIAKQNLQSRIRGVILMGVSNLTRRLLLSTGNKSELATGYATLYGDMNGGYNLLKDLYKTEIYQLAKWRNENLPLVSLHKVKKVFPENIIFKAPTAELDYGQKDSDSLPDYEILDKILYNYIDKLKSKEEIANLGFDAEIVDQVLNLVRISQFKRYQATMGPKISDMSFDLDWRYPITNKYY